jgi:hypothetical protein
MDLIERYLHAVKGHLPLKQQDDVIAELADDLRSRLDDREAELGRPLDEDEVVAILRQLGHPAHLAARYGSWQQLIGPALFPMYVHILKFALGLALLVNVVLAAVLLATGHPVGESLRGLVAFPFVTAIMVFGWVTIVFALIDAKVGPAALADVQSGHKAIFDKWDPRTLPPVPRRPSTVPYWQVVLDLVGAVLILAWWLAVPSNPFLLFGPGAAFLAPGPGLLSGYIPVAILAGLAVVARAIALWRPGYRLVLGLVSNVLGIAGIGVLLWNGGPYVVAVAGADTPADLARAMVWIDRSVVIGMVAVAIITMTDIIKAVWRLWRARRPASGAATASTPPGSLR